MRALLAVAAALLLAGCATPSAPRVLVQTRTEPVPVPTPVPVSPSMTTPAECPEYPPERLTGDDLIAHIRALEGCACRRAAQLADIAIAHGAGGEPVDCGEIDEDGRR